MLQDNRFRALAVGAGICALGYCIYFDKKRRSHPDFKANLIKRRKQQRLEAKKANDVVIPELTDPVVIQEFFLKELQTGEVLLASGNVEDGVKHFATAVAVCGQPKQLLTVLQQSLNPTAFDMLIEMLPAINEKVRESMKRSLPSRVKELEDDLE